jgi:hypothetical protein
MYKVVLLPKRMRISLSWKAAMRNFVVGGVYIVTGGLLIAGGLSGKFPTNSSRVLVVAGIGFLLWGVVTLWRRKLTLLP